MIESEEIKKILPQDYPFVMIDRVVEFKEGESLVAVKNITANEWPFATGKGITIFPETLLIEAAAQAALVFYRLSQSENASKQMFVLGQIKSEFHSLVLIGQQIRLKVTKAKMLPKSGYVEVSIFESSNSVADTTVFYGLLNRN